MKKDETTALEIRRRFIAGFDHAERSPGDAANRLAAWMAVNRGKLDDADFAVLIGIGSALVEQQLETRWHEDDAGPGNV